jgi:hypothetical protein
MYLLHGIYPRVDAESGPNCAVPHKGDSLLFGFNDSFCRTLRPRDTISQTFWPCEVWPPREVSLFGHPRKLPRGSTQKIRYKPNIHWVISANCVVARLNMYWDIFTQKLSTAIYAHAACNKYIQNSNGDTSSQKCFILSITWICFYVLFIHSACHNDKKLNCDTSSRKTFHPINSLKIVF